MTKATGDEGGHRPAVGPIGVVGTGTMGAAIVRRLLGAGCVVHVGDANESAIRPLVGAGAEPAATAREVAESCDIVFTSLPGPRQIAEVVEGPDGLLQAARPSLIHVDVSTTSFAASCHIAATESAAGVAHLAAPVSGGPMAVDKGTLTVIVSGPEAALAQVRPVLGTFASSVFHVGESPGIAPLLKLVNNSVFLCSGLLFQEAVVMAAKAGIDPAEVHSVLSASSAGMYLGMAGPALARSFDNVFFSLALAEKDIALALESADSLAVDMPVTTAAHAVYEAARDAGLGDQVFFATLRALEARAGVELPARSIAPPAPGQQVSRRPRSATHTTTGDSAS